MNYDPTLKPTPELIKAVQTIQRFAVENLLGDDWQIFGLQPVQPTIGYYKARTEIAETKLDKASRELAEAKQRIVQLEKALALADALVLADALINRERNQASSK